MPPPNDPASSSAPASGWRGALSRWWRRAPAEVTGAPPLPPPTSGRGRRLGPWRLDAELGRGASGTVHLATHTVTGKQVALKTLTSEPGQTAAEAGEARSRFLREADAAGRLRHPDIVQVVGSGEDEGVAWLAMRLADGQDLSRHVAPDRLLPTADVLAIAARVADALDHAHRQGVVHRDIKPSNVMVDPRSGQVTVMDFGVARVGDASRTRTGLVLGTPPYMSPEQLAGRPLDGRSDQYALGVLLFQLLVGRLPLQGASLAQMLDAVANTPAPDVRRWRPDLPAELADLVHRLLAKAPEARYPNAAAVARDLRAIAVFLDPETAARPPGPVAVTQPLDLEGVPPSGTIARPDHG